ncbi:hypothetical protein C8R47DRAFT_562683 [Mycena vitilis]|nr:hypothetical protein C8R47DRAFT_562683 [Mycena vitilis]
MGTPKLWSTIILDAALWRSCAIPSKKLLGLLTASLNRGVGYPLTMRIAVDLGDANERVIFKLLSRHSHRWRCVRMWIDTRSFALLASARGHLPLLDTLELFNLAPLDDTTYTDDIFETAPNLGITALTSWHSRPPCASLEATQHFHISQHRFSPRCRANHPQRCYL